MLEHINHVKSLDDQLKEMGANIDDGELAMTLLASLPDEIKPLITALDAVGEEKVTFEKVKSMLLNDADRISDSKKIEDAYSAQRRYNRRKMSRKSDITKDTKVGNFKEHVTTAKKKDILLEIVPNEAIHHNIKIIVNEKVKDLLAVLRRKMSKVILTKKHCTHQMMLHMTFERTRLSNYTEFKKPCIVNLGDNRSILACGKGTYHVNAAVDDHTQNLSLQEVLYLPELEKNLLLVHAIVRRGATVTFKNR